MYPKLKNMSVQLLNAKKLPKFYLTAFLFVNRTYICCAVMVFYARQPALYVGEEESLMNR